MRVAYATIGVLILWLAIATQYWKSSQSVTPHNSWECIAQTCFEREVTLHSIVWFDLHNAHLCFQNKNEHCLQHNSSNHSDTKHLCYYLFRMYDNCPYYNRKHINHFFSKTNHHLGPPIKWWEDIGYEGQRSNLLLNTIHLTTILSKKYNKKCTYDVLHRFQNMAEASSTKNMDVCVVEENEIMNNSQKRTTSALVTITPKKAKSKKNLVPNGLSLWLGFHTLNHINKQKGLPMESLGTTRELMKRGIDYDEAKEMQSAKPSFPFVPQLE